MPKPKLIDIPGIGPAAARRLKESGFPDVASVAGAHPETLAEIHGFSASRASTIIAAARALVVDQPSGPESKASSRDRESGPLKDERTAAARTRRDKKKRKKKDKKRKKKDKKNRKEKKKKGKSKDKSRKKKKHKKKREK